MNDPSSDKRRILLAEDVNVIALTMARALQKAGFEVEIARDGVECLRKAIEAPPDLVILDMMMPKMNGIDATARLKDRYPDITIIGLSVNAGEDNQKAMKEAGATSLITKEAAVEQLYAVIQQNALPGERPV